MTPNQAMQRTAGKAATAVGGFAVRALAAWQVAAGSRQLILCLVRCLAVQRFGTRKAVALATFVLLAACSFTPQRERRAVLVRGRVVDAGSGRSLTNVEVTLRLFTPGFPMASWKGVATLRPDTRGQFAFMVPSGRAFALDSTNPGTVFGGAYEEFGEPKDGMFLTLRHNVVSERPR